MELKQIGVAGNGATFYFLVFAILAGVVGVASKLASASHVRVWRNDSLAAASSSSLIAWAITALAFGLACKEIHLGGYRGWRLRVLEAFIIILALTQLIYVVLLHAGMFGGKYGPGYTDPDYGHEPAPKGTGLVTLCVMDVCMYENSMLLWLYIYIYIYMRKYGIKLNLSLVFDTIFDTVIPSQKKS
ncbi:hypothetical protein DsansV1_C48g0243721 [Dioscorea sansibarensis]